MFANAKANWEEHDSSGGCSHGTWKSYSLRIVSTSATPQRQQTLTEV